MNYQNSNNQFILHDAVHGTVDLRFFKEESENIILLEILNTPFLLRLRTVKQLGFAFYTHISADHNRFSHAIGTMYVMDQIFHQIEKSPTLAKSLEEINEIFSLQLTADDLRKHLVIAGLLQDIGEIPFAQAIQEFIMPSANVENVLKQKLGREYKIKDVKEAFSLHSIYDSDIYERLLKLKINIALIIYLMTGKIYFKTNKQPMISKSLLHIMNGEIDADRLDYVFRDLHHAYGTKGNPRSIIASLLYYDSDGPVFNDPGSVTEFLLTRGHLWTTVYLNPENRFRVSLLKTFFHEINTKQNLKQKLNIIFQLDAKSFKEFDDLRFINLLKDFKNNANDYDLLTNRAKNALDNLLSGVEQYQWYWLPPPTDKQKNLTALNLPNEVYYDLFLKYREHNLFSPKSIRIKAAKFKKLGEYVFLEDCSGAFVGFAQTGWATLPKRTSILVFFPVRPNRENDASWKDFETAFDNDTLYAKLEKRELRARDLDLEINTWYSIKDSSPKIFVSFAFEDIESAKKIATYIKDKGKKIKAVVSPIDGSGIDATTNSVDSVKEADIVIIVFSNNYSQKYAVPGNKDTHVKEEAWTCIVDKKRIIPIPIQNFSAIKNLDFPWTKFNGINDIPTAPYNFDDESDININDFIDKALSQHGI